MGMTIDVTIKNGIDLIDVIKEYWPSDKAIDTVGELVEIAKKYQKVEQIMKKEYHLIGMSDCLVQRLVDIRKVIEDGDID
jgi:hypothetical protein